MQEQSKQIQFFGSDTSLDTSQISQSKFYELANQLIDDTQNIFFTIRHDLVPDEKRLPQNIKYIMNRARILAQSSIPDNINHLNSIGSPKSTLQTLQKAQSRLKQLLIKYTAFFQGRTPYSEFYRLYGKEERDFKRYGQSNQQSFEYGQIIEIPAVTTISPSPKYYQPFNSREKTRQIEELRQETIFTKRILQEQVKNHQIELNRERKLASERIIELLKFISDPKGQLQALILQLNQAQAKIIELANKNNELIQEAEQKDNIIIKITKEAKLLQGQIEDYRKMEGAKYNEDLNRSMHSENYADSNTNKLQRNLNKLALQCDMLRDQLSRERKVVAELKKELEHKKTAKEQSLSRSLHQKTKELTKVYKEMDALRANKFEMQKLEQRSRGMIGSLEAENQELKNQILQEKSVSSHSRKKTHSLNQETKFTVNFYEGDGLEGVTYFENLSYEFKKLFKRACLKSKELLYKGNGMEVGVISEFVHPNIIKIMLHVTNYFQKDVLFNIKFQVISPSDNKLTCSNNCSSISCNQQIKIPIEAIINNYPIGPTILVCNYETGGRKYNTRLLLPVSIIKCLRIHVLERPMTNPKRIPLTVDNKIVKSKKYLRQIFINKDEETLRYLLFHAQTHTSFGLAFDDNLEYLQYEHQEGDQLITEYAIKVIHFLLRKEN